MDYTMPRLAANGAIEPSKRFDERFGALVRLHDQNGRAAKLGGGQSGDESFGRISEPIEPDESAAAAQLVNRFLDDGPAAHPSEKLRYQGQNHALRFLMRSIKRAVEWPGSRGIRITLPAADEDDSSSGRAFLSEAGLPPRTTTSGASRATNGGGDFGSNSTAKSTAPRAATISARSADGVIGRPGRPGNPGFGSRRSRAFASLSIPTTRTSPCERACSIRRTWPGCNRSKAPLANTTRLPLRFHSARRRINSS